jgi:uncharacterized protein (DUF608 family)
MNDWPVIARYDGAHLRELALPVGGIGTGSFALGGRGTLADWQLMSRPNRGWRPMYAHMLLWTRQDRDGRPHAALRVLETDLEDGLAADSGAPAVLAGVPRFQKGTFEASYPFGRLTLTDPATPVVARVEAFNPLIPKDTDASSLPMGLLTVELENTTDTPLEASVTLLLCNIIGADGVVFDLKDNVTERVEVAGWSGMSFHKAREATTARDGTMAVVCDAKDVRVARRWPFRDRPWNGETLGIIDHLLADGFLPDDAPGAPCPPSPKDTWDSSLSAMVRLGPGETKAIRLLVAWYFPRRNLKEVGWWNDREGTDPVVLNHYAARFGDATDVARKVIPRLDNLRARTVAFVKGVADRRAPRVLKEAALSNLTSLRSHTCFRLADGTFAAFEGCNGNTGCCTGSCTHVWNYEEATPALFPDLHRSMIESHLEHGVTPEGAERFRLSLPVADQAWAGAAADGQMGLIVRCYQQFLAGADRAEALAWLKRWWPKIRAMQAFAWVPNGWDADRDGLMEGAQHNTYDVEFYGPNPLCTVWYLAALRASAEMARAVGDGDFARTCGEVFAKGSKAIDETLYNGEYYEQEVKIAPGRPAPLTAMGGAWEKPEPGFQVGKGCLIDQLCGQFKANRVGLGPLVDAMHARTAAGSIFRHNFREGFRDHYNNMRTFATADERGTLICSYPQGGRPAVPFPYWGECMTGFEYQLAVLLLDVGLRDEAVAVVEGVRGRHDGRRRNPFNEPECGSYYARAMASWALLDAWDASPRG